MIVSDSNFLTWHKKISNHHLFGYFWIFWGIYSVLLIFIAGLLFLSNLKILLTAFMAFMFARVFVSPGIYLFYKKPRPYQKLGFVPKHSRLFSFLTKKNNSFPSDHAVAFSSISTIFILNFPFLSWFLIPVALLNGIARVVLGYHYPVDVLAGWLLGVLCALTLANLFPLPFTLSSLFVRMI